MGQDRVDGLSLLRTQDAVEGGVDRVSIETLVFHVQLDAAIPQQVAHLIGAATRQCEMIGKVLGATDDPGFAKGRKPQRLRFVELRILECREP